MDVWFYALTSVFIVSLISLVGVFTLSIKVEKLKTLLIYMVSFSAGALFGDAFIHLLPEIVEEKGFGIEISIYLILGITIFFVIEKIINIRHSHIPLNDDHVHTFTIMNLFGDALHNFIDGLLIGASYLVSIPVGIATTLAVIFHEIPQEIGDFGVLIHGGFSKGKALFYNFLSALTAIIGTVFALFLSTKIENLTTMLIPFAAGAFIYIAGSDLIPELHKEKKFSKSILQLLTFVLGIAVMFSLLMIE